MPTSEARKLLFVVGMHRSGTSALCAALQGCGASFGDNLLAPMAGVNADGFWEEFRQRVRAINPEAYIVGEIWAEAPDWLAGDMVGALTALTGQRFGHDYGAWRSWWAHLPAKFSTQFRPSVWFIGRPPFCYR